MIYNAKEGRIEIQNIKMDYITFGKGRKSLIMIQGLNTNGIKGSSVFLAFMYRIFLKDYKIYMFDRRIDLDENITVKDLAKDIEIVMDFLKIKNADILGVSQGGMIAQNIAIDRPDLVHKLVLAVTLSKNNTTVKNVINNWIDMVEHNNMKKLVLDMSLKMYSDSYVKKYLPFMNILTVLQKPKDINRFKILAKSCLSCNTFDDLEKIKCPVFVIGGSKDKITTGEASVEIAKKLNCKIHMYEDLGHAAYEEAEDFNKKIYDFFME